MGNKTKCSLLLFFLCSSVLNQDAEVPALPISLSGPAHLLEVSLEMGAPPHLSRSQSNWPLWAAKLGSVCALPAIFVWHFGEVPDGILVIHSSRSGVLGVPPELVPESDAQSLHLLLPV